MPPSIVDIPEMADLIASFLFLRDLHNCIRVDKAWYTVFTPYLWRTIAFPPTVDSHRNPSASSLVHYDFFRVAVRDDYLVARRQQDSSQDNKHSSSSFLSRHGPWIRHLSLGQTHFLKPPVSQSTATFRNSSSFAPTTAINTAIVNTTATNDLGNGVSHQPPTAPTSPLSTPPTRVQEPTPQELALHLLDQCPNLTTLDLDGWDDMDETLDFWRRIARDVVPRLVELKVHFFFRSPIIPQLFFGTAQHMPESRPPITNSPSIPAILLAECSHKMRKVQIPRSNLPSQQQQQQEQGVGNDDEKEEGEPLAGLKVLEVSPFNDDGNWSSWKRLLKRCVYLETLHLPAGVESGWSQALAECTSLKRLKVVCIDRPEVRLLTKILRNSGGDSSGLSNLDDIELDYLEQEAVNVTGEDITALLLANRKGWRNIGLSSLRTEQSVEALIHHCATLELLRVNEAPGLTSAHMHHILSSSPRLHTFTTLADGEYPYPEVAYFLPEDFIDLDPITNTLRPWSCESTLRRFCAKIEHIPRPDVTLTHYGLPRTEPEEGIVVEVLQETRTGQSHELQARIYERLARFTQLESLALGHDDRDFGNESLFIIGPDGDPTFGDQHFQYDCLSFSLDSGLQALEALRGLKKLNVFRMATAIGVEEVQWMSRVWPKLESLIGLNPEEAKENDALAWLRENCPRIKLEPFAPWP